VIISPNYPLAPPPDTECTWMIRVELNRRIMLYFNEINIGVGENNYPFVYNIYDKIFYITLYLNECLTSGFDWNGLN